LYVLQTGECNIIVDGEDVGSYSPGQSFGELALMYNQPRKATIQATSKCEVWVLERKVFQQTAQYYKNEQSKKICDTLSRVPSLSILSDNDRHILSESLDESVHEDGEYLIREGQKGDHFYIIESGTVVAEKEGQGVVATMGPGDFFGERALLSEETRAASCRVEGNNCVVLSLDREHFEMMIGSLDTYVAEQQGRLQQKEDATRGAGATSAAPESVKGMQLTDLKYLAVLGEGAFGRVSLVTKNEDSGSKNPTTYALKAMKKMMIVENGLQEHVINEKQVMDALDNPGLLKLYATFQDEYQLYLLLELCQGGELFTYLRDSWKFPEKTAKFYAGSVALGFQHMHSKNIIYRDLKPENLLLDSDG
jgi:CRP-like cAMP-binding protein